MRFSLILALIAIVTSCSQQDFKANYNDESRHVVMDSTVLADVDVEKTIEPYKKELDNKMNEVIGFSAEEFNNAGNETRESTLGDFVCDLLLHQTNQKVEDTVHLAVINHHGGLRTPILKGDITVRNIYELMPFENEMWVLQIDGPTVQAMFNNAAKRRSNCIAGATYTIIDDTLAGDIVIGGKDFDNQKNYLVSISDYLAGGGGGHSFLSAIAPTYDLDYKCRDMIIDYIKTNSGLTGDTLVPAIDGRVKISD